MALKQWVSVQLWEVGMGRRYKPESKHEYTSSHSEHLFDPWTTTSSEVIGNFCGKPSNNRRSTPWIPGMSTYPEQMNSCTLSSSTSILSRTDRLDQVWVSKLESFGYSPTSRHKGNHQSNNIHRCSVLLWLTLLSFSMDAMLNLWKWVATLSLHKCFCR